LVGDGHKWSFVILIFVKKFKIYRSAACEFCTG
jgi:hypothetical protein